MVNHRFYHKIIIVILIFAIFTTSCFASSTSNMIDGMKNLSTVDEIYNYIKTTFGSDGSNVTNSFLNGILQALKKRLSTVHDIVWIDFGTRNSMGAAGDLGDYMYRDSNTQASIYSKLNEFYNRYYTYSDGNAALLNQINTNTTNMYGSQSATNVQLANLNTKLLPWQTFTTDGARYVGTYSSINPDVELNYNSSTRYTGDRLYFRFTSPRSNPDKGVYRVFLPFASAQTLFLNNFISDVKVQYGNVYYSIPYTIEYNSLSVAFDFINYPFPYGNFDIVVYFNLQNGNSVAFFDSRAPYFQFADSNSIGYYLIRELNQTEQINSKINNQGIIEAINNKQLEANVDVSINNTITDNDLTLDVDLPNNATNDTSNLLNKLKQLMLTGVATNQLLNALDDVELHAWYSQSNKAVVEAINNQYTSLYD